MSERIASMLLVAVLGVAVPGVGVAGQSRCDGEAQECVKYMIQSFERKGWIGIELDIEKGESPIVKRVLDGSPAAAAGLQVGDVLVALDGVAYATASEDDLKDAKQAMVPGRVVEISIRRGDEALVVPVTLGTIPQSVLAQWIGNHLIEAHAHQFASAEGGDDAGEDGDEKAGGGESD